MKHEALFMGTKVKIAQIMPDEFEREICVFHRFIIQFDIPFDVPTNRTTGDVCLNSDSGIAS